MHWMAKNQCSCTNERAIFTTMYWYISLTVETIG